MEKFNALVDAVNGYLYGYVLVALLVFGGIMFTLWLLVPQLRLLRAAVASLAEPAHEKGSMSSFQALMVSTASRVGSGNIVGVSAAVLAGGPGAVFWMWIIALFGGASAFVESTLAQIYKCRDEAGHYYGGPAYYIRKAIGSRALGGLFAVFVILLYMGGFNALCAFNTTDFLANYAGGVPHAKVWIGLAVAALAGLVIMGGGRVVARVTQFLVPVMACGYLVMALAVMVLHVRALPHVFATVFREAFNAHSAFGGLFGAVVMSGVKRGLYSNEAGIGSAPNAAASAHVSHPVKQGLAQMLSVFIDTLLICTATAMILLCSGLDPHQFQAGADNARFVQQSMAASFGGGGAVLLTAAFVVFCYTTLVGNYFYAEQAVRYFYAGAHSDKVFMAVWRFAAVLVIFVGALLKAELVWNVSDVIMGVMALVNIPVCIVLGHKAFDALRDYAAQRKAGKNPVYRPEKLYLDTTGMECWTHPRHAPRHAAAPAAGKDAKPAEA
ncbi:MAG: alanine:cation symporter family protein [Kiritimatiellae bacterium]|nr:alanine:cation symporter family protein [Kiritimatiellia bacterium]